MHRYNDRMPRIELFGYDNIVGVFRGFREGGLEFHADLALPYRNEFQSSPMHGQFVLVQLETSEEAVLGRITALSSEGKLSSGTGEDFNLRAVRENRPVPEDLREQYLKYRVNIRILGVVRVNERNAITFIPSHRRLPHVGSAVAFPSGEVLREIAGHHIEGAAIGHFALGEYVYCEGDDVVLDEGMQARAPSVQVRFPLQSLVSRRSFIFARAGFGKSNLNKLLFSALYAETPTVEKRGGRPVPVGTIIFDPDGEYFWPDDKGRPGLCDVPALRDHLVVFTPRKSPSAFYHSFVAGGVKLDLRRFDANHVVSIALSVERQEQQNVRKLRGLPPARWRKLVELAARHGHQAPLKEFCKVLDLDPVKQEAEALAARSNMATIVSMLHDPHSQFMDILLKALTVGKLCVVDVSQMRGSQALMLSGLVLRHIFEHNQREFTEAQPRTIPTIAVIEEAQSVLRDDATSAEPFIAWVKEGRKYDLGALLITQQPGSIPLEILSQGDNWFIFHLLASNDLYNVRAANAHFSEDLLSALLNEPIPGQGVFWSSVGGKAYPISVRVSSFEKLYRPLDPDYNREEIQTYARQLSDEFDAIRARAADAVGLPSDITSTDAEDETLSLSPLDLYERRAIAALRANTDLLSRIRGAGVPWGELNRFMETNLPADLDDRSELAYRLVPRALNEILGSQDVGWHRFEHGGRGWVKAGRAP